MKTRTAALTLATSIAIVVATMAQVVGPGQPPRDPRLGQESPATGTATVSGVVMMAGSGQPARKVRVNLSGSELRSGRSTVTDDQGRFSFTALPAGRYSLSANKPGHLNVTYGQRRPGAQGTQIQLSEGQKFQAQLQLPRGGVLTGTVLDENGEATPGTSVRAMRFVTQNGRRTLQSSGGGNTDDRGIYRIYGLQPGDYVVCATPRNNQVGDFDRVRAELAGLRQAADVAARGGEVEARAIQERMAAVRDSMPQADETLAGYAPVCYPGTTTPAEATAVPLAAGEERPGVDFQLRLVPMARVEGTVVNSTGAQLQGIEVTLQDAAPGSLSLGNANSRSVDADGRFTLPGVAPGQYRLTARGRIGGPPRGPVPPGAMEMIGRGGPGQVPPPQPITVWASTDITVDGRHVSNVMLSLQNGMSVSGQITFEGSTTAPGDPTRLRVTVIPADPGPNQGSNAARVDAAGRFVVPSLAPGRYRISAGGAPGWFVESASIAGVEALDFPFEIKPGQNVSGVTITMTDRQTELTGVMVDNKNQPALDYTLVIFPADQKLWTGSSRRIQTIRPATDGRYTIRNLPPGEYKIATLLDIEPGAAQDANFLQQIESATMRITLAAGEKKTQDIRLAIQ